MITYSTENVKMPLLRRRDTSAWIRRVASGYGKRVGEVGYLFCDDEKILEVNREFLQHDYYTDIITFDYCEDDVLNGDIVISLDTVRSNAEMLGKDYDEELFTLFSQFIVTITTFLRQSNFNALSFTVGII